ncbi:MAG: hypothetical protein QOD38_1038, partial [Acidimicrobiaceae bacterium]
MDLGRLIRDRLREALKHEDAEGQ